MQRAEMDPVSDPSARCLLCRLTLRAQPIMRGSLELLRRRKRPGLGLARFRRGPITHRQCALDTLALLDHLGISK
jgi:hypothetical protein